MDERPRGMGMLRIHLCGEVRVEGTDEHGSGSPLAGRQGRLAFAFLVAERHRAVVREELADVLWSGDLPPSWTTSISAIVSKLRRFLSDIGLDGQTALASTLGSYRLNLPDDTWVDVEDAADAVSRAEQALVERDAAGALVAALQAREIVSLDFTLDESAWGQDFRSRLRDLLVRAVHAQAESILLAGDAKRAIAPAEEAVALEPFREAGYRLLMRAYAGSGERAEALRTWERCRELLAAELGTDPAPETEAVYLEILRAADESGLPTGVVTFLVSDIERSSELWETQPAEMNAALEAHDRTIRDLVSRHGGQVVKGLGDGMFAVFRRASGAASAALAVRDHFADGDLRVRLALHTGEAFERDGDYFGPTVNRVSRMSAVAIAGQILASQATVEVLRDQGLPIRDLGVYELKGLSRAEHLYEIGVEDEVPDDAGVRERPVVPSALAGAGPFVGRSDELDALADAWERAKNGDQRAVLLGGEPGVGKTRLSGECARRAYDDGALVLYGRCDEDLAAPYQPFAQAARTIVDYWGPSRLRTLPGIEEIARLVPEIAQLVPGLPSPTRGEPEEERYVLFDALARLFVATSMDVPVVLVLDDLHWAAKPTLLLLRHLLRFAAQARLLIVGTYRDTELDRTHPLAGVLVDLHRDDVVDRISLSGLEVDAVAEYVTASGHDDARLPRAIADVTSGNPFFMIEVLRHIDESGGAWDARTLPQGVKEATGRRLSHLSPEANDSLLVAAVSGSVFSLDLVERVSERECVDHIEEARHAGLVLEGDAVGQYRFAHAIVRQVLLSEVATVKRVRLHLKIAAVLEETGADEADLAHHYFECAWAGHAAKAAEYCARAADRAMERLAYEEATDLYDKALQSMDVEPDAFGDEQRAELLLSRCEAALAAGDIAAAAASVEWLQKVAQRNRRLTAWATTFAGQLAILVHPDRLRETERAVASAAQELAELGDLSGAAQAHTVHAMCLFRLGRVAECETSLDAALTAARAADDHRRVNAMLAQAPVAAMYGPSPVPRAGGRCLDIVRQLRITTGSPAVEAVAIRCQAVLESFRGRTQAARRMIENARTMLEQLGHRVGLLEVDLFAGLVELVAGEPEEAERLLRNAYDGFVRLGLDADAAHAAARLARACVRLDRMDEAYELTEVSERLGGDSPESAVVWRCARAEVLADRGELDEARRIAEEAVAMAEGTDKPSEQGIANMALATVHRAAGDERAARASAEKAALVAERKGAIALVELARAFAGEVRQIDEVEPVRDDGAVPENACWRVVKRWHSGFVPETYAPDAVVDDSRVQSIRSFAFAGDASSRLTSLQAMGVKRVDSTLLATRGERLVLMRPTLIGEDPAFGDAFELAGFLSVLRINEDGLIDLTVRFEENDVDAAFAKLNELFIAGEGAEHADVLRAISERDRSWADVTFVDHRPAGFATTKSQQSHEQRRMSALEFMPSPTMRREAVLALDDHGAVVQLRFEGTTHDGASYEWPHLCVFGVEGGELRTVDLYAAENRDAALARLRALGAATPPLENAAIRAADRLRHLVEDERWDEVAAAITDDFVADPRTEDALFLPRDRDTHLEWLRAGADSWGRIHRTYTDIATRGDRLSLRHLRRARTGDDADGFEAELLLVHEVDEAGSIKVIVAFHPGDLDGAFEELDARYTAGEGARYADAYRVAATSWGDDVFFVDHRRGGFGVAASKERFDRIRASARELMSGTKARVASIVAIDERAALLHHVATTDRDGTSYEWSFLRIALVERGRLTRVEIFEPDAVDAAMARFEALRAAELENASTRLGDRIAALVGEERWDDIAELISDDFTWTTPLQAFKTNDKQAFIDGLRVTPDVWGDVLSVVTKVLAIRGERLSLIHRTRERVDGAAAQFSRDSLAVREVGDDGLLKSVAYLDGDDLDAAFGELNERYTAGEGREFADVFRVILTDRSVDTVFVDHRMTLVPPAETFEDHIQRVAITRELTSSFDYRAAAVLALDAHGALFHMRDEGVTEDGSTYEWEHLTLVAVRNGVRTRIELFDLDARDAALARFLELRSLIELENTAAKVTRIAEAAIVEGDVDRAHAVLTDEVVLADLRSGHDGLLSGTGAEHWIASFNALVEAGFRSRSAEVVAIRGDRLALSRLKVADADGNTLEALELVELGADGRAAWVGYHDVDDLDAAFDELERRYNVGEGRDVAAFAAGHPLAPHLHRNRDWDAYRAICADDLIVVDHRPGGWGTIIGADAWIEHSRTLVELAPDVRFYAPAIHRVTRSGSLRRVLMTTAEDSGGHVETEFIGLARFAGPPGARRFVRLENFALDDLERALRRFDELEHTTAPLENTATRISDQLRALVQQDRWDEAGTLIAEDHAFQSRMVTSPPGRDGYIATLRAGNETWEGINRSATTIAVRGDRLALYRNTLERDEDVADRFSAEMLIVREIDEQGLVSATIIFDSGDLEAALEELDRRYEKIEGVPRPWARRRTGGDSMRLSTRDWDQLAARYTDDLCVHDHRPGGFGTIRGREERIRYLQTMVDVASDAVWYWSDIYESNERGHLGRLTRVATTGSGADLLTEQINIVRYRGDGLRYLVEVFDLDQIDDARRRFEELERSQLSELNNAAIRHGRHVHQLLEERRWDEVRARVSAGFVSESRLATAIPSADREAFMRNVEAFADFWANLMETPIATRGERLSLGRVTFLTDDAAPGAPEMHSLLLREIDEDGLGKALIWFRPPDIEAAFEELDQRYMAGEGARFAEIYGVARARTPFTDPDSFADDFVSVDHRPGSELLDVRSKEELFGVLHLAGRSIPSAHLIAVHALNEHGAVVSSVVRDDHDLEWGFVFVRWVRGGVIVRSDAFNDDQLDEALAFFETHREAPRLENAATRNRDAWATVITARDLERLAELATPDFVSERRIGNELVPSRMNIREFIDWMRTQDAVGMMEGGASVTTLAIRGDTLGLFRLELKSDTEPGAFTYGFLVVREVNDEGLLKRSIYFAPDDLAGAFKELNRLYMAGEAAPYADVYRIAGSNVATTPELFAPDVVTRDRRKASALNYSSRDEVLAGIGHQLSQIEEPYLRCTVVHALDERGGVFQTVLEETAADGNAMEWGQIFVRFVKDGQIVRQEIFNDDQVDEALAVFAAHREPLRLENACTRHGDAWGEAIRTRDYERLVELAAPGFVSERRLAADVVSARMDIHEFVEWVRTQEEVGIHPRARVGSGALAIRGETLGLFRIGIPRDTDPGAFTYDRLIVREVTPDGLATHLMFFDAEDIDEAFDELDRWYMAGEAAAHADVFDIARAHLHDRPGAFADDMALIDHRPGSGVDLRSKDEFLEFLDVGHREVTNRLVAVHALDGRGAVVRKVIHEGGDAAAFEWELIFVRWVRNGAIVRTDVFNADQLDEALEFFAQPENPDRLQNICTRAREARRGAVMDDPSRLKEFATPDFVAERRVGEQLIPSSMNIDEYVEFIRTNRAAGFGRGSVSATTLAIRGETLALSHVDLKSDTEPGAFTYSVLEVQEVTPDGLTKRVVSFAPDDLAAAFAELNRRYLAGEGAEHADVLGPVLEQGVLNARDWDAHRAWLADDFVSRDHRPGAFGETDAEGTIRASQALFELVPDAFVSASRFHAIGRATVCAEIAATGTGAEGAIAEWRFLTLFTIRDGKIRSRDLFALDRLDDALALFNRLESELA